MATRKAEPHQDRHKSPARVGGKASKAARGTSAPEGKREPVLSLPGPAGLGSRAFPIVGLGASAGGLEALEEFFKHMPPDSGMAFVVVTHQHPGHTSLLPELLRKHTRMPVAEASDGQRIEPNHVYLSRAECELAMLGGRFQIMKLPQHDGVHLPIDRFFRALAEDQRERAVAIVLSGTGTDGTLGLKAIKGAGGMTIAQEAESARYAGMPGNAVATGLVDHVLRPEQIPRRLAAYAKGSYVAESGTAPGNEAALAEPLHKILLLLRSRTKHDLSLYKASTLRRRIERRTRVHDLKSPQEYLRYLQENPHESDLLFKELLIGVTSFFRDPEAFEALAKRGLPDLLRSKPEEAAVRVWVPGCATGEEAYSLAILVQEGLERLKKRLTVQIFGTDLDSEAINLARLGRYPGGIAGDVPRERLARYFVREEGGYRIRNEIRELVVFAPHNVLQDPPFTKLDLIGCRNLLIYLQPEAQQRLLSLFHYALKPQALLFLGSSEGINEFGRLFRAVDGKRKIFARTATATAAAAQRPAGLPARSFAPATSAAEETPGRERIPAPPTGPLFEQVLLDQFAPASVVVNERGDISYIHGHTGDYLEPASGQPRLNILEMAREGLRFELATALRRATAKRGKAVEESVRIKTDAGFKPVTVGVTRISRPESLRGQLLVTFRPAPGAAAQRPTKALRESAKRPAGREDELERELVFTRESLQGTVEELQTSNEELKSANEELQSTNEEFQSANEELETSREEMQSLNEELQTVNAQLRSKVEALSEASDDMQNLLNATAIATIFLDGELKIRWFTEQARTIMNLIPSDVGRPIGDLVSKLNYDELEADAAEVLRTLHRREREAQTGGGDWRLVRILPYRTANNAIDGLVVMFIDINRTKRAEQAAQQAREFAESIVATVREPMLVLDPDLRVVSASRSFCRFFRLSHAEVEQRHLYELGNRQWDIPRLRRLIENILPKKEALEDFEVEQRFTGLGRRVMLLNARRLEQGPGGAGLILLAMQDMTGPRLPTREKAVPAESKGHS
ncbi:MAG TPA: chemotaxis protein CheB [Candidatus Acidoferrum sp.]|jgi:two-component system CheB/CheR fusion protein|nr:chemotaxis protein CheB [Candidatus Acidoferrum sp.]